MTEQRDEFFDFKVETKKIVSLTEDQVKEAARRAVGAPASAWFQMETDHQGINDFRIIWNEDKAS